MTLMRVNESDSGGEFVLLNLRAVARMECHGFDGEQRRHRVTIFTSGGGACTWSGWMRTGWSQPWRT